MLLRDRSGAAQQRRLRALVHRSVQYARVAGGNIKGETMMPLPIRDFARLCLDEAALADERTVLRVSRRCVAADKRTSKSRNRKAPAQRTAKER